MSRRIYVWYPDDASQCILDVGESKEMYRTDIPCSCPINALRAKEFPEQHTAKGKGADAL